MSGSGSGSGNNNNNDNNDNNDNLRQAWKLLADAPWVMGAVLEDDSAGVEEIVGAAVTDCTGSLSRGGGWVSGVKRFLDEVKQRHNKVLFDRAG